jgi:replicative DNA helicase
LPEQTLPVDPYVLGVWLGDGNVDRAGITSVDQPILQEIAAAGHVLTPWSTAERKAPRYGISHLQRTLRQLSLLHNQHIPAIYQRTSLVQRLALLQGLMDTDGYCDARQGTCEFSSTSERLARDVYELVCGLGAKATLRMKPCQGKRPESSIAYTVAFTSTLQTFRLQRKLRRQKTQLRPTPDYRYIVDVRPIRSVPVQCIAVDAPSHLFLAGRECIPTHNTQLAAQVALHVGERHGPVVFVSMELTEADLGTRFVAIVTAIAKERLVTGNLDAAQQAQVTDALARLERSRVHIAYGGFTTGGVRAFTLQAQAVEGVRPALIVVDYLQLLRDQEGDGRNREHNISQAARSLKGLAQELQVPVLALAQFNRDLNGRGDKRPALTDLRDSGDLENTADSVLGLYRDEMHHPDTDDKHLAEVVVLKKRQLGEDVGSVRRLMWLGEKYGDFDWQSAGRGRLP